MVGRRLARRRLVCGGRIAATTRRADMVGPRRLFLDLAYADPRQLWPWLVDIAYVCAGVPGLEAGWSDPMGTAHINVTGVMATITSLVAQGAFVVYLSTNLVFDGLSPCRQADDSHCPRTKYGRQKAEVERQLSVFGTQAAVVRFTKIVGHDTPLLRAWIEAIPTGRENRTSICSATVGLREPVPTYTSLDTARLRSDLGMNPPDVWRAFEDLLAETSV